jgi:hypothetical protein
MCSRWRKNHTSCCDMLVGSALHEQDHTDMEWSGLRFLFPFPFVSISFIKVFYDLQVSLYKRQSVPAKKEIRSKMCNHLDVWLVDSHFLCPDGRYRIYVLAATARLERDGFWINFAWEPTEVCWIRDTPNQNSFPSSILNVVPSILCVHQYVLVDRVHLWSS